MKIDIYVRESGPYEKEYSYKCSTTQAKTCREARATFLKHYPAYDPKNVHAKRVLATV